MFLLYYQWAIVLSQIFVTYVNPLCLINCQVRVKTIPSMLDRNDFHTGTIQYQLCIRCITLQAPFVFCLVGDDTATASAIKWSFSRCLRCLGCRSTTCTSHEWRINCMCHCLLSSMFDSCTNVIIFNLQSYVQCYIPKVQNRIQASDQTLALTHFGLALPDQCEK